MVGQIKLCFKLSLFGSHLGAHLFKAKRHLRRQKKLGSGKGRSKEEKKVLWQSVSPLSCYIPRLYLFFLEDLSN